MGISAKSSTFAFEDRLGSAGYRFCREGADVLVEPFRSFQDKVKARIIQVAANPILKPFAGSPTHSGCAFSSHSLLKAFTGYSGACEPDY